MCDHYAAARMYESLSRLSDAELERRGLRRATLAQDLFPICDRKDEANTAMIETEHIKEDRARASRPGEAARACAGANNFDRRSA